MNYKAPRGTVDILPQDSLKWQTLEQLIRTICANYNVKEVRTPIFEHTDLFCRSVGDTTDIVTKEMYTFADKKGRSITLRPEGTAGVARAYVEHKMYANPDKISKLYYIGPMFRYERPQNGRQRQFHQFGVEMIGYESPYLDVECMTMAVTLVKALGLKGVKLHINTLGDNESHDAYREALKAHFKPYLNDLCSDCRNRYEANPLRILDCKVDHEHPAMASAPKTIDFLSDKAKAHFETVCNLLDELEIEYVVDPNLVRGLDYYCHTVFEVISDDPRLGAGSTVGGGGRYNGLVQELGGPEAPGVGFAFGMERLLIAMDDQLQEDDGLDVYVMPLGVAAKELAMQITTMLRANGFSVDMDYQDRSLKAQFKTVDRLNSHFAMIIGDKEVEQEVVNIKCTHSKTQDVVPIENIVAYIEEHMEGHSHE
ncbi:histidine--tRNA ligase [uncultured Thomasclavelia sp.]|uniref:histidine--tRNA ligase n=1 Tax=uncultured Thomasclavelia sp. TaxID=3025759 RepID=UPI0025F94EEE|nr:histidine--tRNA ligase [uncultured Thomasclavelia sp.]